MSAVQVPRLETLRHATLEILAEAIPERASRLVRNVVLLGPHSRNGYHYSPAAMQAAQPLYDNRPVFLDHAEEPGSPTRRKLRDYAGQVIAPRYEGDRLRGDLRLLGPHADWLLDLMEAAPRDIGMSHVILGRRDAQGQQVEQIERVISVDIVAFPATTQSFQEGAFQEGGLAEVAWRQGEPATNPEELFQAGEASSRWETLLATSKVPPVLRPLFLQTLRSHAEPEKLLQLLEQWASLLERETPSSLARAGEKQWPLALRHSLVQAVRGQ